MNKLLFLNSKARNSGSIYDLDVHFDTSMFRVEKGDLLKMKLMSFNCKHNFYNLEAARNIYFTITEDGTPTTVALSEGNYDVDEIGTMIQTLLNANVSNYTFVVAHNAHTGKYTITPTLTGSGVTLTITFSTSYDTHEIFGLEEQTYDLTSALTSTYISSIGNEEALYIHINSGNNLHYNGTNSSTHKSSVFAKIPILAEHFGQIYWESLGSGEYSINFTSGHNANMLSFRITNEYGLPIQLQSNWSMVFSLSTVSI